MVGHKLGEFAPTRTFHGHDADDKTVKEALGILEYTNKAASPAISKVVKSAAQNAVYNNDADAEKLYVKAIFVDEGPILKRFAARAKGSGTRILKRTCHITCVVDER